HLAFDQELHLGALELGTSGKGSILACGGRLGRFGDHLLGACEVSGRQEGRGEVEQRLCPFGLVPEQRYRAFEEADCGRHVAAGGGPSRGSGEQISSSRREVLAVSVERAELAAKPDRLLEVVGDKLVELASLLREPARAAFVQRR